jgi:hypothetical protein
MELVELAASIRRQLEVVSCGSASCVVVGEVTSREGKGKVSRAGGGGRIECEAKFRRGARLACSHGHETVSVCVCVCVGGWGWERGSCEL